MPTRTSVGSRRPGDEALDEPGDDERADEAEDDDHGPPPLLGERVPAAAVAGGDQRPAEPQAGGAGDDHGADLEQAVGEDQPPEPARTRRRRGTARRPRRRWRR